MDPDTERMNRILRRIAESVPDLFPRQPRYRYFEHKQTMYCWTTERMNGKFVAFNYRPFGEGSRTGKATEWKLEKERKFRTRKAAKACAIKRYEKAKEDKWKRVKTSATS